MVSLPLLTARTIIRRFEPQHITDSYIGWLNDPETVRYSAQRHQRHTRHSCESYLSSFAEGENLFLSIALRGPEPCPVGTATIYVDRPNGVGDIGILIGDGASRGVGLGAEIWPTLIGFAFRELALRKVTAGTLAVNKPMLALFRKAGMVEDGRRQGQALWQGQPVDLVYGAAFRATWPADLAVDEA